MDEERSDLDEGPVVDRAESGNNWNSLRDTEAVRMMKSSEMGVEEQWKIHRHMEAV